MCFICSPQTHLCMASKPHDSQVIVLSKPNACFYGMRSWPWQSKEVHNISFVCWAQMWFWLMYKRRFSFSLKTHLSHIALQHEGRQDVRLRGEHAISEVSVWLMFVRRNLALPRGLCLRLLQTPSENPNSTHLRQYVVSSY